MSRDRGTTLLLAIGLIATVSAAAAPCIDQSTSQVLAAHIREGCPTYSTDEVDTVVRYEYIVGAIGVAGAAGWVAPRWAARRHPHRAKYLAASLLLLGIAVSLNALRTKDRSGPVGVAPQLAWVQFVPWLVGLGAVTSMWRRA